MRHRQHRPRGFLIVALVMIVAVLAGACAPAATPTVAPTKAPAAAATTSAPAAAPTAAATKPAAAPTAAPTAVATKPAAGPTAAAAAKPPTGTPIKMGVILPLSGPQAYLGVMANIAINLAMEDTNAAGGVNGSPIVLVTEDSPFDPKQAVTAMRKLAEQDKVFAIEGPFASGEIEVAAPLAGDLKIPEVGPTLMIPEVLAQGRPWAFGMNFPHEIAAPRYIADFKKAYPNVKTVVLVGDTKERVTQYATKNVLPKVITDAGLKLLDTIEFDTSLTDFSAIVTKIKGENPDGIVVASLLTAALGLSKELQKQQVPAKVVTNNNPLSGSIIDIGGTAVEGWVQASLFDSEVADPVVQSFVKRVFDRANADPKVTAPKPKLLVTEPLYYDTAMMLFDSMRKGGVNGDTPLLDARQKIQAQFNAIKDYKGIGGSWTIGSNGHAVRTAPPSILLTKDGYKFIR
ncbi:MAG: ABC transporter substrate-binding protein [Dehalococcoidia bacterium]|nr:ABC transporter substrate-binding protein [Dehalococcoidia bacterium]